MKWYQNYLSVYNRPFNEISGETVDRVKRKLTELQNNTPLVSVVIIAHNEATRIFSCIWSLCENQYNFPIELLVINNNSMDDTEDVLKQINVTYYNEAQKGPGYARQCGLNHAKGEYLLCIDADTIYPPSYIQTMVDALKPQHIACAYTLWSFIPDENHSPISLFLYESMRDIYLRIQNINRPELNVRGMVFAFKTEYARKEGFRTDIIRGEDGSLALGLKKYGKIAFIRLRKARAITGYGTVSADGSFFRSFMKRVVKGLLNITSLFYGKQEYKDKDSNLIK